MDIPKRLFHGTTLEAYQNIKRVGLLPSFPAVYMTEDLFVAQKYGEVILEIDTSKLDKDLLGTYRELLCDIWNCHDFWHYYEAIPTSAFKVMENKKGKTNGIRI